MSLPRLAVVALAVFLSLSTLPAASAGTPDAPEITDPSGDVDPLSLLGLKPQELEQVQTNISMFDITKAYVTLESRTQFILVIEAVDLDGGASDPPQPPVPPPTPPVPVPVPVPYAPTPALVATFQAHFTSVGAPYVAQATIEPWHYIDPPTQTVFVWFLANFTLHKDDADLTPLGKLFGAVDPFNNRVYFVVPKELVGNPEPGALLERFFATSEQNGTVLDYAPNAVLDPTQLDPFAPGLAPGYGDEYVFGQFPGAPAVFLRLEAEGATSGTAPVATPISFSFRVTNLATQADPVRMTTRTPSGWAVAFDEQQFEVPAGGSVTKTFTVTPSERARASGSLVLKAISGLNGQYQETTYTVELDGASSGPTGGSKSPSTPGGTTGGAHGKESPGVPFVLVTAALAFAAFALRRRR